MGTQKALRRAASLLASGCLVAAVSCLSPTEVTLVLTTDIPCVSQRGTSIAVGDPGDITTSAPVTVTGDCTLVGSDGEVEDGGELTVPASIGSLVVVPSGSRSASFAVQIVTAVAPVVQPSDCLAPMYQGCIVARRQVSFIPHTPLTLPIEMTLDCLNVSCAPNNTCYQGQCKSALAVCTSNGMCPLAVATPDASSSGDDDAMEEAGFDATMSTPDAPAGDEPPVDGPSVVVPEEASAMDAPATDGLPDAPTMDAPVESGEDVPPEASIHDAAAGESDASEASPPPIDAGIVGDGSPLGACVEAGSPSGVECGTTRCAVADVCCVGYVSGGGGTSESCTAPGACDYTSTGSTTYSSLGCRNAGDCDTGKVCCVALSLAGGGSIAQCLASCPYTPIQQTRACQNSCECPTAQPQCNPGTCFGYSLGFCGGTSGSACL